MAEKPGSSEVTPEEHYLRRRAFIKNAALFAGTALGVGGALVALSGGKRAEEVAVEGAEVSENALQHNTSPYRVDEPSTSYADITSYNNFYEFGTSKSDPAANAHTLNPRPWRIRIDGEVDVPQTVDVDMLIDEIPLEERIYRMRCVEAWSMVIPWLGFPLHKLLERAKPTDRAKYVAFSTLLDPEQMPGQRRRTLQWPYIEALRLDEAMHPLTQMAVGLYGKRLPNQNAAPIRLVVPWKYGFKGIKYIVSIRLTSEEPRTSWNLAAPGEYGFYANVNPEVDHPRWTQATERRIGDFTRRPTLPFNGYEDEVADLYSGMDLRRYF